MSLSTLFTIYIFSALVIFLLLACRKKRLRSFTTTTTCVTCGETYIVKKTKGLTRCPQCNSLQ